MKKGFTLLGLLVVITVVGVLLSTLIVSINNKAWEEASSPLGTVTEMIPAATGHVNDYANVISDGKQVQLEKFLSEYPREISVLTVDTTGSLSIEEYAIRVGEAWKVGDETADDGVIFIVAVQDRRVRIEVGYGAETYLNDAKAGQILDNLVIPHFKNGDWESGIQAGVDGIIEAGK